MNGQWIGQYGDSSSGQIVVNIDELQDNYAGVAYLNEADRRVPSTIAHFRTKSKDHRFEIETDAISAVDPKTGDEAPWETVKKYYAEGAGISKRANVTGRLCNDYLELSWTTDLPDLNGTAQLPRSAANQRSELPTERMNWDTFKRYVASLAPQHYLFRGQNKPWRLRTSFHRSGRAYLERFQREDVPARYRQLSARTRHVFKLMIPEENGAFYNLVQHHGYPTPLLDWTYSPYVAAYFAYRGISNDDAKRASPDDLVRIIVFDQLDWRKWSQLNHLLRSGLHVSIQEFPAIENERMIPQQAASTITNVDDIETYVLRKCPGSRTLFAVDLPVGERSEVVRELGYMGITAGSLFPGLDGACEELKERYFQS